MSRRKTRLPSKSPAHTHNAQRARIANRQYLIEFTFFKYTARHTHAPHIASSLLGSNLISNLAAVVVASCDNIYSFIHISQQRTG